jgi:hypothetical protein
LVESECDKSPVSHLRMLLGMFNELKEELKENIQKQLHE